MRHAIAQEAHHELMVRQAPILVDVVHVEDAAGFLPLN